MQHYLYNEQSNLFNVFIDISLCVKGEIHGYKYLLQLEVLHAHKRAVFDTTQYIHVKQKANG